MLIKLLILSSPPPILNEMNILILFRQFYSLFYEKSYTSLPIQVITATINLKIYTIS